jgi:hypothetical protein
MVIEPEEMASEFIVPIWQSVDSDYKRKYALNIWQQFEDSLKSSASVKDLSSFYSRLKRRLNIEPNKENASKIVNFIARYDNSKEVMDILRTKSPYIVLVCRAINEQAKEARELKKDKPNQIKPELF